MRMRSLLAAAAAATLLTAPAATAGTGSSTICHGGDVVLTNPVTVAVKQTRSGNNTKVWICYSTTPPGTPGMGGALHLDLWTYTSPLGTHVGVACYPDGAGVPCIQIVELLVAPGDAGVGFGSGCLLYAGSNCLVPAPVVMLDGSAAPLLFVYAAGQPVTVNSPVRCLSPQPC